MGLEDYSPDIDSSEWIWNSAEAAKDASEKYQEAARKAWAKIAKTQKDEKKAKKYDFLLAGFLVKIIVDKKYDFVLDSLFPTIHTWYPSNFVLWILSLINIEISNKIRETTWKNQIVFNYETKNEIEEFDDSNISFQIRDRINYWVEDIIDSVTLEYSHIQTQKLINLLETDEIILKTYCSKIFTFFLNELNIKISSSKSEWISLFIIWEIQKSLNKLEIENI